MRLQDQRETLHGVSMMVDTVCEFLNGRFDCMMGASSLNLDGLGVETSGRSSGHNCNLLFLTTHVNMRYFNTLYSPCKTFLRNEL